MPALSNYLVNKLIDALFRGVSFTPPSPLYLALYTANPTAAGGGTEVTGGSYARVSVATDATTWSATNATGSTASTSTGTSGTTSNNATITFPTPTANWGTVTAVGVFDASTGGNLLSFAPLAIAQVDNTGNPLFFPASALAFSLS